MLFLIDILSVKLLVYMVLLECLLALGSKETCYMHLHFVYSYLFEFVLFCNYSRLSSEKEIRIRCVDDYLYQYM